MRLRTLAILLPAFGLLLLSVYSGIAVPADTLNAARAPSAFGQPGGIFNVAGSRLPQTYELGGNR